LYRIGYLDKEANKENITMEFAAYFVAAKETFAYLLKGNLVDKMPEGEMKHIGVKLGSALNLSDKFTFEVSRKTVSYPVVSDNDGSINSIAYDGSVGRVIDEIKQDGGAILRVLTGGTSDDGDIYYASAEIEYLAAAGDLMQELAEEFNKVWRNRYCPFYVEIYHDGTLEDVSRSMVHGHVELRDYIRGMQVNEQPCTLIYVSAERVWEFRTLQDALEGDYS
jgi:hypothetical protein